MIDQDIYGMVDGSTAYAPLVSVIGKRLVPKPPKGKPQGLAVPMICYQIISEVPIYTSEQRAALTPSRVQFDIYGRTILETQAAQNQLVAALARFKWSNFIIGARKNGDPVTQEVYPSLDVNIFHQAFT